MAGQISVTAEVVGIGSDGTEPSVVFAIHRHGVYSTDKTLLKRYLFNCGEGTQRLCGENGIKLNSLDSIFLTRLDVRSASGIPGLVFALGGLGAAQVRIHGPQGTRDRLTAMESFVRRKYPKIECFEVKRQGCDIDDDHPGFAIPMRCWASGEPLEDPHSRIIAVPLDTVSASDAIDVEKSGCRICTRCSPLKDNKPVAAAPMNKSIDQEEAQDPDRQWLRCFYDSKGLEEKIPHMDAILRRYSGRMDELKTQLSTKYGTLELSESSSSSSSSEDGDEKDTTASTGISRKPLDLAAPLDREWLQAFYKHFEPAKVGRIDQVLRQFAGREDQLKAMLLTKYGEGTAQDVATPPAKKQKIDANPPPAVEAEIQEVIVEREDSVDEASHGLDSDRGERSLCYILQFCSAPFPVVWIVDCHSVAQISSLHYNFRVGSCSHAPVLVVHFTPPAVFHLHQYQRWIHHVDSSSNITAEHLAFDGRTLRKVDGGVFSFAFVASARSYVKEHCSESVPVESRWGKLTQLLTTIGASGSRQDTGNLARTQLKLLVPLSQAAKTAHLAQAKLRFTLKHNATADYAQTGWQFVQKRHIAEDPDNDAPPIASTQAPRPRIHFTAARTLSILGTGSAAPSKLRASTSIYLSLSSGSVQGGTVRPGMLIDCGEGAYGQLQRQFDTDTALEARLAGLQCVWISHHHADHQCGLLRVLDEYVRATQAASFGSANLFVIAPHNVVDYVKAWLPDLPSRIRLATCADMNDRLPELKLHLRDYIRVMRSVRVWHCHDAFGLILWLSDGTKVVYSGDTKPCDQLVRSGMDADLLIHEATFDDSMEQDADRKKHSTVGQALAVARRMRAKRVVLTHFSQRYPSLPPPMSTCSDRPVSTYPNEVYCASDGFTIEV